ncbi:MAG: hypothetical protein QOI66_384 [Myxococcales bacterium]|jgi:hypothetical protein|nr:hypothetical protein [Myxococcales bacterium]
MTSPRSTSRFAIAILTPLVLLGACAKPEADDFRDGVPTREAAELKVPGASTQASALTAEGDVDVGVVKGALLGQTAEFYFLTRTVTAVVNTGTVAILGLVKTITTFPPTSLKGDVAVWGPYTEPLSPNTWRVTVTRLEPQKFQYELVARSKLKTDADFVTILSGTHTRAVDAAGFPREGFGAGNFTLDWDAAQTLPEHDKNVGKATFTYARPGLIDKVTIDVDFKGVKDDKTGELHDAVYKYASTPGAGGDFQYSSTQDFSPDPGNTGTAKETLTIHSRWMETGAGRADVRMTGGDLAATPVTTNECWSLSFASTWKTINVAPLLGWGDESSCVFSPAEYSTL